MFARIFFLSCLLLLPAATIQAQTQQSFDMEQAVTRAIAANPQIQSAKQQIYGAKESVRASAAAFGPTGTISGYTNATKSKYPVATSQDLGSPFAALGVPTNTYLVTGQGDKSYQAFLTGIDLSVTQPLFTGFRLLSSYQRAKLAKDQADSLYKRTELTLIRSVQTAFLTLLKARSDVKSNEDAVARLKSQLQVTKAFYDVGLRPRLDLLQAEADLATAEQSLLSAQNSLEVQLAQLNALLNIPLHESVDYTGQLTAVPFGMTLQQALDEAYKFRPDIYIALKSMEIAEKDSTIALSSALPQFQASYDYIRQSDRWDFRSQGMTPSSSFYSERHQFQLTATWKAWDWGNTLFTYRAAKDNVKKLQADLANLRLTVGAEVKTQYLNITEASKRIGVAKVGLEAANEGYRMAVARYQAQVGTNTDVLDAQARVTRAEFQHTQAMTDYQIAIANLSYSIGRKNLTLATK